MLQVFNNLSWIVSYAGVQATENLFSDVPDKISSTNDFSNIIKILENVHICVGVNNQPFIALQAETVNIHGEIIGSLQSVTTVNKDGNEQVVSTRRSTSCTYFIHNTTSSRCSSCNLLRRNLSVQLVRYNNGNSINGKRAMSEDERKGREHELKRKLINTEKREKYWKFKATEMKKLKNVTEHNDDDLLEMFVELDKGKGANGEEVMFPGNDKMNMFWEMQRDVVPKADRKTSIRWHPE